MNHRTTVCGALIAFLAVSCVGQTTRLVPSQYPTIQAAVAACVNGDNVAVAPGVYPGVITFLGKQINVHSSGGAAVTTLQGTPGNSVVTFASNENSASILDGFTISGGAGVFIQNASPTIQNCRITNNARTGMGGGVFCQATGTATASPFINGCVITSNTSINNGGAGLGFDAPSSSMSFPVISNTVFSWNAPVANGSPAGGGVALNGNCSATFSGCTFDHNSTNNVGGACFIQSASASFTSCTFTSNHAGSHAGAISLSGNLSLINCQITDNSCGQMGGAIYCSGGQSAVIKNCTISGNTASTGVSGASFYFGPVSLSISNSILWGNIGGSNLECQAGSITYSDIGTGFYTPGVGTISLDPRFKDAANADYHLTTTSPCRDTGAPGTTGLPATDVDGRPRIVGAAVDMGSDEIPALTFPGTADGLDLYAVTNGSGDPLASTRAAGSGNHLLITLKSTTASLVGGLPLFAAELYANASPPTPLAPGIWLDYSAIIVYGAVSAPPFGFPGLPAAGLTFDFTVPPGLAGNTVRFQGFVSTATAINGSLATSNAPEVTF